MVPVSGQRPISSSVSGKRPESKRHTQNGSKLMVALRPGGLSPIINCSPYNRSMKITHWKNGERGTDRITCCGSD